MDLGSASRSAAPLIPGLTADRRGSILLKLPSLTEGGALAVAETFALLPPAARRRGIGLADVACLALGRALGVRVLTMDRDWLSLEAPLSVRVDVTR